MTLYKEFPPVKISFVPSVLASDEFTWLYNDAVHQYPIAYAAQLKGLTDQFDLSQKAAEKVLKNLRPDPNKPPRHDRQLDFFLQLGREIGRHDEILQAYSVLTSHPSVDVKTAAEACAQLWGAIYCYPSSAMQQLWEERIQTVEPLAQKLSTDRSGQVLLPLQDEILKYYEGLHRLLNGPPKSDQMQQ
jgi:hypothetical protein